MYISFFSDLLGTMWNVYRLLSHASFLNMPLFCRCGSKMSRVFSLHINCMESSCSIIINVNEMPSDVFEKIMYVR